MIYFLLPCWILSVHFTYSVFHYCLFPSHTFISCFLTKLKLRVCSFRDHFLSPCWIRYSNPEIFLINYEEFIWPLPLFQIRLSRREIWTVSLMLHCFRCIICFIHCHLTLVWTDLWSWGTDVASTNKHCHVMYVSFSRFILDPNNLHTNYLNAPALKDILVLSSLFLYEYATSEISFKTFTV